MTQIAAHIFAGVVYASLVSIIAFSTFMIWKSRKGPKRTKAIDESYAPEAEASGHYISILTLAENQHGIGE
jgi:hypothetical protein